MTFKAISKANSTVQKKNGELFKKGNPLEHSTKHFQKDGAPVVGVSIGTTLNMGDYESLRVDVWLTDEAKGSETIQQAYERVTNIVSETLAEIVAEYKED